MGNLFKTSTVSSTSARISSFMVTTSTYNSPIKIVFGTTMIAPVLADYDDFVALAHTTTSSSGGKGGSVKSSNTTYTYTVMALLLLGEGIITGTGNIWEGSKTTDASALGLTFFNGSIAQSPWGYLLTHHPEKALTYSGTSYLAGIIDLGDSSSLPNFNIEVYGLCQSQQSAPSRVKVKQTAYIKVVEISNWSSNINVQEYVYGGSSGNYWTVINSRYYTIAQKKDSLGNNIAGTYVYTFNFDDRTDGNDRDDPLYIRINYNAVTASVSYTATDANPRDIIYQLLTSTVFGANFPAVLIDNMDVYSNYCKTNKLLISPAYDSSQQANSIITSLMETTNSEYVFSQGKAKFIPYYDGSTPIYDLSDDNIVEQGDDTLVITRTDQDDAWNVVPLEYFDRSNQYNTGMVYATDQGDIDINGLRQASTLSHHEIMSASLAQTVAQTVLQRKLYRRNIYTFTVTPEFVLLEPMDPVTLTLALTGLGITSIRVVSIKENSKDYSLKLTCESNPSGVSSAPIYETQDTSRGSINLLASPGTANDPIIFDPPPQLTGGNMATWVIASGSNVNCGGFNVWISLDNTTYKNVGHVDSNKSMGVLSATLPIGTSPDTVNTLSVNLTESLGNLVSGTQADADQYTTLCYVDGELIAYETATLTALNVYSLSYLVRGVYGSTIASHAVGTKFSRLNSAVFKYQFADNMIGQTVYIKLTAINVFGNKEQELSEVTPYTHVLTNAGKGSSSASYTYYQSSLSATWVITHNLNKYPAISCIDSSNNAITGSISYNSANQLTVSFSQPVSGSAYLT